MRFICNVDCFYGESKFEQFAESHGRVFQGRGMVLLDASLEGHQGVASYLASLRGSGIDSGPIVIVPITREPTYDDLDQLASQVKAMSPDYLVAIGGGSLLDLAKGVSVLLNNPGRGIDFRGMDRVTVPPRPLVVTPTTAGTGSEVTWTASFIDDESGLKLGINGPNVFPAAAILEPALLVGTPRDVAMSAGLDALVHAVEAVSSPMATAITSPLAVRAARLVLEGLPDALSHTNDPLQWERVQVGAFLAGLAMLNSSGGPASGVSYPIGVHYEVPHGYAGGIVLPLVVRSNVDRGYAGYAILAARRSQDGNSSALALSRMFADELDQFMKDLDAPQDFARWGIDSVDAVDLIVGDTLLNREANLRLNPLPFGETELREVLERACARES